MKRVLVTGASGFIGRHALQPLRDRGFEVHAVTRAEADLLDERAARALIRQVRPSHLLHFAWYAEHGRFWTSAENLRWVAASLGLAEEFAEQGGKRMVVAGTCAEYDWTSGVCIEGTTPLAPSTLYGASKQGLATILGAWCAQRGIELAWGRVFFLFGEDEAPQRLVASVIRSLLAGEPAACTGGEQLRDFLYVRDCAEAFAALVDSEVQGAVNVASGSPLRVRELVEKVAGTIGRPDLVRLGALPDRPGDPPSVTADVRRLRGEVGWRERFGIDAGLEATIDWWRRRG